LAWEPSGDGIYVGGRFETLHRVDLRSGQMETLANVGVVANTLELNSDGSQLVSGHDDGSIRIWNLKDGSTKTMLLHRLPVRSIALSHDGRLGVSADEDANIAIWFPDSAERIGVFNLQPKWSNDSYRHRPAMVFTPDDRQLRVLFRAPDNKSMLRTWDLKP
jgi:WD40 repeat protein